TVTALTPSEACGDPSVGARPGVTLSVSGAAGPAPETASGGVGASVDDVSVGTPVAASGVPLGARSPVSGVHRGPSAFAVSPQARAASSRVVDMSDGRTGCPPLL